MSGARSRHHLFPHSAYNLQAQTSWGWKQTAGVIGRFIDYLVLKMSLCFSFPKVPCSPIRPLEPLSEMGSIDIFILQLRKLRPRESNWLTQGPFISTTSIKTQTFWSQDPWTLTTKVNSVKVLVMALEKRELTGNMKEVEKSTSCPFPETSSYLRD